MWPFTSREEKLRIDAGRADWEAFAEKAASGEPQVVREALGRLQDSTNAAALPEDERRRRAEEAFRAYSEKAFADGRLSSEEDAVWSELATTFGYGTEEWQGRLNDIGRRVAIVLANEGRPATIDSPKLLTKPGETVHLELGASLLGEERQELGGHFIGTAQVVTDQGTLSLTSERIVFLGARRSFEFPYSMLVGMDQFTDGVRFQVSNNDAPLFRLAEGWGEVTVAIVNAARRRASEDAVEEAG